MPNGGQIPPPFASGIKAPAPALPGTRKCSKSSCVTCELIIEGTTFKSQMTGKEYRFMTPVNCESSNVIYLVSPFNLL